MFRDRVQQKILNDSGTYANILIFGCSQKLIIAAFYADPVIDWKIKTISVRIELPRSKTDERYYLGCAKFIVDESITKGRPIIHLYISVLLHAVEYTQVNPVFTWRHVS